jgi:hypothetical protein
MTRFIHMSSINGLSGSCCSFMSAQQPEPQLIYADPGWTKAAQTQQAGRIWTTNMLLLSRTHVAASCVLETCCVIPRSQKACGLLLSSMTSAVVSTGDPRFPPFLVYIMCSATRCKQIWTLTLQTHTTNTFRNLQPKQPTVNMASIEQKNEVAQEKVRQGAGLLAARLNGLHSTAMEAHMLTHAAPCCSCCSLLCFTPPNPPPSLHYPAPTSLTTVRQGLRGAER